MNIKKLFSFATATIMLFVFTTSNPIEAKNNELENSFTQLSKINLNETELLTESEIPDAIEYSYALEKGHYERVAGKQSLLEIWNNV